jgi:hypothetical protein
MIDEVVDDDSDLCDAYVTLCVHAGIAAADVICCARLGRHAQGENHNDAIGLLEKVDTTHAQALGVLLGMKTRSGYSAVPTSTTDRKRARRAAGALVDAARLIAR